MEVWAERRVKSKGESRKEETGEEWLPQLDILNFFMGKRRTNDHLVVLFYFYFYFFLESFNI